ncbi:exodeoxyribonuclease VII large subunit [Bartonella sp. DGB1]|uniref:exodeoxyribonuclease VII large subunit n=1 Tax=Bartonella sp. DGB1 TaxID=3239807 RepID=UPI003523B55C
MQDECLEFSVSSLSLALKKSVEDNFSNIQLRGEISGYKGAHASGHLYFSIKDENARIDVIMWKWNVSKLSVQPQDGMEVIVNGNVTTFGKTSKYQIVIDKMQVAGEGALLALLEERKKKLAALGLFDESRKQKLPFFPKIISVITSPTGAVIRDIWKTLLHRFPTHMSLWSVNVQGENSSKEICNAIKECNKLTANTDIKRPDVIIIARGGGSIEDLWGYNDEELIHAVSESKIPIISAIGHETDWTLLDLVSDLRVSTPTAAAEASTPKLQELIQKIDELSNRKKVAITKLIELKYKELNFAVRILNNLDNILAVPYQQFDILSNRLIEALTNYITVKKTDRYELLTYRLINFSWDSYFYKYKQRLQYLSNQQIYFVKQKIIHLTQSLSSLARLLENLSYLRILDKGFALILDKNNKAIVRAQNIQPNKLIKIKFADAEIQAIAKITANNSHKITSSNNLQGNLLANLLDDVNE